MKPLLRVLLVIESIKNHYIHSALLSMYVYMTSLKTRFSTLYDQRSMHWETVTTWFEKRIIYISSMILIAAGVLVMLLALMSVTPEMAWITKEVFF